jgi:hypothetical protein
MIYFDSDMSKSTNTEVCFDWKKVIYIYVRGRCRTQFMLPMEKSVTFTWRIGGIYFLNVTSACDTGSVNSIVTGKNHMTYRTSLTTPPHNVNFT